MSNYVNKKDVMDAIKKYGIGLEMVSDPLCGDQDNASKGFMVLYHFYNITNYRLFYLKLIYIIILL